MFSETKHTGDEGNIAEDLFSADRELESRCYAVLKSVEEDYFTINEALSLYEVSEFQYLAYRLLREDYAMDKQQQLIKALNILFRLFQPSTSDFDSKGRKILNELQEFAQ